jgi:hypothetical protein
MSRQKNLFIKSISTRQPREESKKRIQVEWDHDTERDKAEERFRKEVDAERFKRFAAKKKRMKRKKYDPLELTIKGRVAPVKMTEGGIKHSSDLVGYLLEELTEDEDMPDKNVLGTANKVLEMGKKTRVPRPVIPKHIPMRDKRRMIADREPKRAKVDTMTKERYNQLLASLSAETQKERKKHGESKRQIAERRIREQRKKGKIDYSEKFPVGYGDKWVNLALGDEILDKMEKIKEGKFVYVWTEIPIIQKLIDAIKNPHTCDDKECDRYLVLAESDTFWKSMFEFQFGKPKKGVKMRGKYFETYLETRDAVRKLTGKIHTPNVERYFDIPNVNLYDKIYMLRGLRLMWVRNEKVYLAMNLYVKNLIDNIGNIPSFYIDLIRKNPNDPILFYRVMKRHKIGQLAKGEVYELMKKDPWIWFELRWYFKLYLSGEATIDHYRVPTFSLIFEVLNYNGDWIWSTVDEKKVLLEFVYTFAEKIYEKNYPTLMEKLNDISLWEYIAEKSAYWLQYIPSGLHREFGEKYPEMIKYFKKRRIDSGL